MFDLLKALQRKIDTYINDNEQAVLKKKNSQEHNVMKKVSSFTLPAVVVGMSVARKRKKSKWITDFEVTKFSTIILGFTDSSFADGFWR